MKLGARWKCIGALLVTAPVGAVIFVLFGNYLFPIPLTGAKNMAIAEFEELSNLGLIISTDYKYKGEKLNINSESVDFVWRSLVTPEDSLVIVVALRPIEVTSYRVGDGQRYRTIIKSVARNKPSLDHKN